MQYKFVDDPFIYDEIWKEKINRGGRFICIKRFINSSKWSCINNVTLTLFSSYSEMYFLLFCILYFFFLFVCIIFMFFPIHIRLLLFAADFSFFFFFFSLPHFNSIMSFLWMCVCLSGTAQTNTHTSVHLVSIFYRRDKIAFIWSLVSFLCDYNKFCFWWLFECIHSFFLLPLSLSISISLAYMHIFCRCFSGDVHDLANSKRIFFSFVVLFYCVHYLTIHKACEKHNTEKKQHHCFQLIWIVKFPLRNAV